MKLIFGNTFLKKASSYDITLDDLEDWISVHWSGYQLHGFHLLCSPLPDTNAYKGYYSGVDRIIMFHLTSKGILYPVYIGDKSDPIAKNITVSLVKRHAQYWVDAFLLDLQSNNYKVRHIPDN